MKEQLEKKIENWRGNIYKEYYINKKEQYHGQYKRYWSNGKLWDQMEYKNNQLNGFYKDKWNDGSFNFVNTQKKHERFGLMIDFSN